MPEWRKTSLGAVAEIRFSNVDKKSHPAEIPVRLCNYMDVYANDYVRSDFDFMAATAARLEIQKFRVDAGDVIITKDSETPDDIGIPAVVEHSIDNLVCGYHLALIKPRRDQVDSIFLAKQLASLELASYFSRRANGSTRYGLSSKTILDAPLRLAPIAEQQRVGQVLRAVDESIRQTETLIAKMQQVQVGLMRDLFTRGVTPDRCLRPSRDEAPHLYEHSRVGWIPADWRTGRFGSSVSVIDPNPSHRYPSEVEDGIPICSTENFRDEDDYDLSRSKRVPFETWTNQARRCGFTPDDVVFARKGRIGLARRYGVEQKVFSHTIAIFKPAVKSVDPRWLVWAARSETFLSAIDREINANLGVPTLGLAVIQSIELPWPGLVEQKLIAESLDAVAQSIAAERESLRALRQVRSGLMQDLLTGRVRVHA